MLIKYKFSDKVMEVNVKKCGRPSQQNPLEKKVFSVLSPGYRDMDLGR
jgi:hypothetical protein